MKKCVNILLTYPDGNIYVVRKVKYDEIKKHNIKNIIELENYCNKKNLLEDNGANNFSYDREVEKDIIAYLGCQNGKINWNPNYNEFEIEKIFDFQNRTEFVVRAYPGIGSLEHELIIGIIINTVYDVLKFIFCNIFRLSTALSYKIMAKKVYKDADFINSVILKNNKWPVGFINEDKFFMLKFCEKHIMKNNGYKKIDNFWIKP